MNASFGHRSRLESDAFETRRPEEAATAAREKVLRLHGHAFVADPSGVLYWPEEHLLIVADLHLEKGSSYAARRVFLPPYDTSATLARLTDVVGRLSPRRVVALGDSFHDGGGAARLLPHDIQTLRALQVGRDWIWIAGNHDPAPPAGLEGVHASELAVGPICFRHEHRSRPATGKSPVTCIPPPSSAGAAERCVGAASWPTRSAASSRPSGPMSAA